MWPDFPLFPESASSVASDVDALYLTWVGISFFFSLLIALAIVVFFIHFRRRPGQKVGSPVHGSIPLEIAWSAIPLVIALGMFAWGARVFFDLSRPPDDAVEYTAIGKQWMWKFQHPEGVREINDLHVPVGQPIKLRMTSQDVIHSFYVPAFRVKADVIPGRYTTVWFEATQPGVYHLFCAEYCGTEHSKMGGYVYALAPQDYEDWLATGTVGVTPQVSGAELFSQLVCDTCHRPMGDMPPRGPRLEGLFGNQVALQSGETVIVDESYIRESILSPQAKIVAGWQPVMPTYRGQITEEQINALISYIKSMAGTEQTQEPGALPGSTAGAE